MSITKHIGGDALIQMMEAVQDICKSIHTIRANNNIRVRQPLQSATVADPQGKYSWLPFAKDMQDCIKDECNIKEIHYQHKEGLFVL